MNKKPLFASAPIPFSADIQPIERAVSVLVPNRATACLFASAILLIGYLLGFSGLLPLAFPLSAAMVMIAHDALPVSQRAAIDHTLTQVAVLCGGWKVFMGLLSVAAFVGVVAYGAPAHALLDNAKAAATSSIGEQLGETAVDFFFGGLMLIFFFVIAGALLAGGVQVARSENPGVFFTVALVFAMILGTLELFDKMMFATTAA